VSFSHIDGIAVMLRRKSFFFVLKIYLAQLEPVGHTGSNETLSSALPAAAAAARNRREVYKRVMKVFQLQWRSLVIAMLVLVIVVLFAVVFVVVDSQTLAAAHDSTLFLPWAMCLVESAGDSKQCTEYLHGLAPNEATLLGTLIMLSIVGIAAYILLSPIAVFKGWMDFIKSKRQLKRSQSPEDPDDIVGFERVQPIKTTQSSMISRVSTNPNGLYGQNVGPATLSPRSDSLDVLNYSLEKEYGSPSIARSSFGEPARSSMVLDWDDRYSFVELDTGVSPKI